MRWSTHKIMFVAHNSSWMVSELEDIFLLAREDWCKSIFGKINISLLNFIYFIFILYYDAFLVFIYLFEGNSFPNLFFIFNIIRVF
jgi:hypothetical protein